MPFDPRRHPRWPRGAPDDTSGDGQGGRFAEAGDLAGSIVGNLHGVTTGPWHQRASDQMGQRRGEHPRQQYNQRVVEAGRQQMRENIADDFDDPALANAMRQHLVVAGRGAEEDVAVDNIRAQLNLNYPERGGALPPAPDPREGPRSSNRDSENVNLLNEAQAVQRRIQASNAEGDWDEGLQIRIDRLAAEQGRTGRRVEADRAAEDLRQYMADDPEGLIAAHGQPPPVVPRPAAGRPDPSTQGDSDAVSTVLRIYDAGNPLEIYDDAVHEWYGISTMRAGTGQDRRVEIHWQGGQARMLPDSEIRWRVRPGASGTTHGRQSDGEERSADQVAQVTGANPERSSLNTIGQMVNGGVAVDIQQSDGTWHEVESITADSPHLGNLVIHYRGTGFVDHRPADEQIPYRVVDFTVPVQVTADYAPAHMQVQSDVRLEIRDHNETTGQDYWRRITRAEYTDNGVTMWFADGDSMSAPRDLRLAFRVERRPAGTVRDAGVRVDPRSEADRALVFQREDNDRYNQRVYDRAVEIDQENADLADSEDEGIRRLREKMQTYRDAMENPDDPESVDAAIDDLVDELADWDIFFNAQGFTVSSHDQSSEPQRPDYNAPTLLPIGHRGPVLTSSYQPPPPMPRRTTVADLQPGQTLSGGLQANTGYAFEDQVPQGYRDAIHEIYDYYDRHTGMRSEVTDMSISGNEAEIVGKIYNQDGSKIGSFRRKIGPGTNIYHSRFEIDDRGAQGGGFTSRWFEQVKQQYREQGFRTVTVSANIDVGGYAWAKIGFDFQSRTDAGALLSKAGSTGAVKLAVGELSDETMAEWETLQRRWDAGEWITPLEISRIGWAQRHEDIFDGYPRETDNGDQIEMWLGKYIMLGSSWAGKLTL